MHIAIARFPAVPAERDKDFREWFAGSNDQLRTMVGLRGRRLLRSPDGSCTALVEHDCANSFAARPRAQAISMIHHGLAGWAGLRRLRSAIGSVISNRAPLPGPSLWTRSCPWWASTIALAMVSPMPLPAPFAVRDESPL